MWPFGSSYPERTVDDIDDEYDYIVIDAPLAAMFLLT